MLDKNNGWYKNNGKGIKIAVIDSGIKIDHPKLAQYTFSGYNITNDSNNIEDRLGHGTAITGIIKNHVPCAEIFAVKIFDDDYYVDFFDLCNALEYIYKNIDFHVLNLSIGLTECPDHIKLENLCDMLSEKGVVVSAFDNFGAISYPAAYSSVIGVDGTLEYTNPWEFDYIEDSTINIRGKGGNQRILWADPDYMIQGGSSFACAHITGLIAKMVQNNKLSKKDILCELRANAMNIYETQSYQNNFPKFIIKNAVCFPYNKEIDAITRNQSQLSFNLCGVYDSKYNINIGKEIGEGIKILDIEKLDWHSNFDTVVLGHIGELSCLSKTDYYKKISENCKKYNKNLFQFDDVNNSDSVYSPNIKMNYIPPLNYGKLYMIGKPIIAVMGTSPRQGKFTLQLSLRKELNSLGYKVGQLGTEPQSILFGFDESFSCGYGADISLDEQTSIGYINYLLSKIERKNPDIIILGGQSGLIPYAMYNLRNNSPYQKEILQAANPDVIILCVNYFDDIEYIIRTVKYAQVLTTSKVVALSLFPFERAYSWNSTSSNLKFVDEEGLKKRKEEIETQVGVEVFLQKQTNLLCEKIINYLSDEE
ncbi:MAG: S8 family serine peptidase [Firmicutes bacterium]|nr:S8 family serine peptidase [Bacillota bacterium]